MILAIITVVILIILVILVIIAIPMVRPPYDSFSAEIRRAFDLPPTGAREKNHSSGK